MVINVHTHVYHAPDPPAGQSPTAGEGPSSAGLLRRSGCEGWIATATEGERPGEDVLVVSGLEIPRCVETWRAKGVDRLCVCPSGRLVAEEGVEDSGNGVVESLFEEYPDFFIGFGRVRPETDRPGYVDELAKRGFKGLKFINPAVPYDDESIFPFYERAEKHGLVCLFHLGWLGLGGRRRKRGPHVTRVHNMQPVHLDATARVFTELNMVGAHLGTMSYCLQAIDMARYVPNVYFDLSGGFIRRLPWEFLRVLFGTQKEQCLVEPETVFCGKVFEKMVFASDNAEPDVFLTFYRNLMEMLKAPQEMRDRVMGGTLQRLLGL